MFKVTDKNLAEEKKFILNNDCVRYGAITWKCGSKITLLWVWGMSAFTVVKRTRCFLSWNLKLTDNLLNFSFCKRRKTIQFTKIDFVLKNIFENMFYKPVQCLPHSKWWTLTEKCLLLAKWDNYVSGSATSSFRLTNVF